MWLVAGKGEHLKRRLRDKNCVKGSLSEEQFLELLGGGFLHAWQHMRINVQGHDCAGVPKPLCDDFRVLTSSQEQGRACVTEVIGAQWSEASCFHDWLEVPLHHSPIVEWIPPLGSEHQV